MITEQCYFSWFNLSREHKTGQWKSLFKLANWSCLDSYHRISLPTYTYIWLLAMILFRKKAWDCYIWFLKVFLYFNQGYFSSLVLRLRIWKTRLAQRVKLHVNHNSNTERWSPRLVGVQYSTGKKQRNSSRRNEDSEPKRKQCLVVDVSGGQRKIWCCKKQYHIGTWNVRSINQG